MCTAIGIDELNIGAHPAAGAPHATFEYVANAEFTPDLLRIHCFSLVGESDIARDYEAFGIRERSVVMSSVMPSAK
jgi:hypothetical protein